MADFTLDLNEDQLQIQKWVHDFAANVIRPAGPEWDEREETPWPIIEEAARIGLYSWEFLANAFSDKTGLTLALVSEELAWGDAGITLALLGTSLGVSGIVGSGTPEQIAEWVPQCFGTADDIHLAAFAVSEPDAGSDVSGLRTRAVYDEAKDEWVINGAKTWITNGGITKVPTIHVVVATVDPELKSRGHAAFVVPAGTAGVTMGQKFKKMGIRASHTAEVVFDDVRIPGSCLLGGKEKLDSRLRARQAGNQLQGAGRDEHVRSVASDGRRAGARHRAGRLRILTRVRQDAGSVRSADHHEPGDRVQARRHEDAHRRRPSPRVARVLDGRERQALRSRRRLDVEAVRGGDRGQGHRGRDPGSRRRGLRARTPRRAMAPRLEDLHDI